MAVDESERSAPSEPLRAAFGRFAPGSSGNPGGRPSYPAELRDACRDATDDAVAVLRELLTSKREPGSVRLRAARELLDRGYGPPALTPPTPPAAPLIEGVVVDLAAQGEARRVADLVEAAYVVGVEQVPRAGAAWRRLHEFRELRKWALAGELTAAEFTALGLHQLGALLPWGWKPGLVRTD